MAIADLDHHRLAQQRELARGGIRVGGDRDARVQALAAGLVGEHEQARGVVPPDATQAVGDLAAPGVLDEHDHVEHAGRGEVAAFGVALGEQRAQGSFDRVRGRALLAPDGVGAAHQIARQR